MKGRIPMVRQAVRQYNPPELEKTVQARWAGENIYTRTKNHRSGGENFYFIDGPPYTTGSIHMGTAWNKTLKDLKIRYQRMNGFNVRDQPGYDMHGLPIEVKVEKSLGIKNKKEIELFGMDNFISRCKEFALANMEKMTSQFKGLGVWMDWDRPYTTIVNPYIEAAWWTLKRADEKNLLTRYERVITWCPRCATALAEAEVEYWDEEDPSIYVRFKLADSEDCLLIWTTTPWTLPADLAVSVHPDFTYVRGRAARGAHSEVLIFIKDRLEDVRKVGGYDNIEVLSEMQGSELEGRKYIQPLLEEVPVHKSLKGYWVHKVVLDTSVTNENTGCVHTAPGHGPIDFEIGKRHDLPPFCPVDGQGHFTADAGKYAELELKAANEVILADLKNKGLLLASGKITHRYGHCWRCKSAIIYLATMQWYLKITQVKQRMLEEVARVKWFPPYAGSSRQRDWVDGARDWCISRQRFWGIPMPVWECACGNKKVVGSAAELREGRGYSDMMDLHRPWIDGVTFDCSCGKTMHRVPDVMDVWLDSGVAAWAQLGFPGDDNEFRKWFPCRWITEAHDQTRGWFYSQLGAGVIAFDRAPYDQVLMHGWSLDAQGRPMSKSLGNVVEPVELTSKHGADALRLYFILASAPWEDMPFSADGVREAYRTLNILWNVHVFSTTYMALDHFNPEGYSLDRVVGEGRPEDVWMLSRIETLTKTVTENIENNSFHLAGRALEDFILEDLSRWYVRLVRDRTWVEGDDADKNCAYRVLYEAIFRTALLLAPVCPHICDEIYLDLGQRHPTIHMEDWPALHPELVKPALELQMAAARKIVEAALDARNQAARKLRMPIGRISISSTDETVLLAITSLRAIILDQVNCKEIVSIEGDVEGRTASCTPVSKKTGPKFQKKAGAVGEAIRKFTNQDLEKIARDGKLLLRIDGADFEITSDMYVATYNLPAGMMDSKFAGGSVYLDLTLTDALRGEGYARDLIRRFQEMRKEAKLNVEDRIIAAAVPDEEHSRLLAGWKELIRNEIRASELEFSHSKIGDIRNSGAGSLVKEWDLDGSEKITLGIRKADS